MQYRQTRFKEMFTPETTPPPTDAEPQNNHTNQSMATCGPSSPPHPLFPRGHKIWNTHNTIPAGRHHERPVETQSPLPRGGKFQRIVRRVLAKRTNETSSSEPTTCPLSIAAPIALSHGIHQQSHMAPQKPSPVTPPLPVVLGGMVEFVNHYSEQQQSRIPWESVSVRDPQSQPTTPVRRTSAPEHIMSGALPLSNSPIQSTTPTSPLDSPPRRVRSMSAHSLTSLTPSGFRNSVGTLNQPTSSTSERNHNRMSQWFEGIGDIDLDLHQYEFTIEIARSVKITSGRPTQVCIAEVGVARTVSYRRSPSPPVLINIRQPSTTIGTPAHHDQITNNSNTHDSVMTNVEKIQDDAA